MQLLVTELTVPGVTDADLLVSFSNPLHNIVMYTFMKHLIQQENTWITMRLKPVWLKVSLAHCTNQSSGSSIALASRSHRGKDSRRHNQIKISVLEHWGKNIMQ